MEGGKFLTFSWSKEEYALEILKVQEIIGMMPITPVSEYARLHPRRTESAPERIIAGHGTAHPLRSDAGWKIPEETPCIALWFQSGSYLNGLVGRQGILEVAEIDTKQIEEVPTLGGAMHNEYLSGYR